MSLFEKKINNCSNILKTYVKLLKNWGWGASSPKFSSFLKENAQLKKKQGMGKGHQTITKTNLQY